MRSVPRVRRLAVALAAAACPLVHAQPGYYVVTAYDNAGRLSADLRYWTIKKRDEPVMEWPEVGLSYGVTSRWTTGLLASWIGSSAEPTRRESLSWSNDVLLTQGEWPVDIALHTRLIVNDERRDGDAFEFGPVLQADLGRTRLHLNLFFERHAHDLRNKPTELNYQWQALHRVAPGWRLGVQGFGELGRWDDWSPHERQSHRAGPAAAFELPLAGGSTLLTQAAWVAGSVYRGQRASMLSLRVAWSY